MELQEAVCTFIFLSEKSKVHKSSHFCKMVDMCTEQWWPSVITAGCRAKEVFHVYPLVPKACNTYSKS